MNIHRNILCTFPGRHGDLLWALPTVRAIAEHVGHPVDFATSAKYGRIGGLVERQDYIDTVHVLQDWQVQETAPMTPAEPPHIPAGYDKVIHLAYPGWPEDTLPFYIWKIASLQMRGIPSIDLQRPWIGSQLGVTTYVSVGFSDEYFELKYGLWSLLTRQRFTDILGGNWISVSGGPGSRWVTEGQHGESSWVLTAETIADTQIFLGCCSALHVLACALGKPVLVMEPNEQRWNPIFYPYGMDGPQVTVIRGGDGRPTFDARHVREAIDAHLQR